ncbi:GNAT family N-acetyltransferase [Sphingomonas xanthus]|uniref:GNAT family N-acetyltransferase n=1 Tax=Sphingomonas xanthus TaxID=2594473 RepID=A0A516ITI2_9SPHN|nr:GNAT family N-acetyltransferase [Sphingomonas xanthus]QDP20187.1 GNAT family N-acetyltransferase [Sphingomonas xanthus]
MVELRTPRLLLRRARMDDLADVHAVMSDPEVMRYWSTAPHREIDQTERWLRSMVDADPAGSDDFLIERGGRVIGKLGCWQLPEIGFQLARDQWGQGLASEAMAVFIARRRSIGASSRLTADVDPRNLASLELLRRHGFVETGRVAGTWQIGDELCDSVYLALDL